MLSLRFVAVTLLLVVSATHSASALSIDEAAGTNKDGSPRFSDPDDRIPFPHVADDGQPSSSYNLQSQPVGNSGLSFGLTSSASEPDAFERAKARMQQ